MFIDLIIIIIILLSILFSYSKGFTNEILSNILFIYSIFIANNYYSYISYRFINISNRYLRNLISIFIIFIITYFIGFIILNILSLLINKLGLSKFDKLLGLIYGFFRGIFLVYIILIPLNIFTDINKTNYWIKSKLIPLFIMILKKIISKYLNKFLKIYF